MSNPVEENPADLVTRRVPAERREGLARYLNLPPDAETTEAAWLFEAVHDGQLLGGLCVRPQPGGTALVETPRVEPEDNIAIAAALLRTAVSELATSGTRLAQALLEGEPEGTAESIAKAFEAAGFEHAADLAYLAATEDLFPTTLPSSDLAFEAFDESQTDRLARLIERTYVGSLDCPALDGMRSLEEVLQSYQATGAYDPARWFFARHAGQDVGCLLLTEHPADGDPADWPMEVVYMGVVPAARGRGWGRVLVQQAQWIARQRGRRRLLLAVDASNQPAVRTYSECGFTAWAMRAVWLKFFSLTPR